VGTRLARQDEQWIDALQGTYKESFLLHYNFPALFVVRPAATGAPGRREIGHGKLAAAIHPVLPRKRPSFPTPSASSPRSPSRTAHRRWRRCAARRCRLMDAGVPLKRPTAGIAIGLILEDKGLMRCVRQSSATRDIRRHGLQGRRHRSRRHLAADDIKIAGITEEIIRSRLSQRKTAACISSARMSKALPTRADRRAWRRASNHGRSRSTRSAGDRLGAS